MNCPKCGFTGFALSSACPACGNIIPGPGAARQRLSTGAIPWEDPRSREKPLSSIIATIGRLFASPTLFFGAVKESSPITPAFWFALITGSFGLLMTFIWTQLISSTVDIYLSRNLIPYDSSSSIYLAVAPFVIISQVLITALYIHFMLMLFRSRHASFNSTIKSVLYAEGAMALQALPAIGSIAAPVAWLVFILIAMKTVHKISILRAFTVLVVPFLILAFLAIVATVFLVLIALFTGTGLDFLRLL